MSDFAVRVIMGALKPGSRAATEAYRKLYLNTEHWRKFRMEAHTHYEGVCSECGGYVTLNQANVHHIRYFDAHGSILFREKYDDVRVVHQGECHRRADRKRKKALRRS